MLVYRQDGYKLMDIDLFGKGPKLAKRNIIVMGGSAGSFAAFKTITAGLPADLDASIFIVWHMAPNLLGVMPEVLNRYGKLRATEARDGEQIEPGRIYFARPDYHLMIEGNMVRVTRGPKENRFRPAVDPLFRSAAFSHRQRVIGVVLSGALDDGTSGLWTIKYYGGTAIVQDPSDAEVPSMPENAIREVNVDYVVPVDKMAELLVRLASETVEISEVVMENEKQVETEVGIAKEDNAFKAGIMNLGSLTPFTCPECHGVLTELTEGTRQRYRCHTGHAFSADSLLATVTENIEDSMWNTIRGIEESIMLLDQMGQHLSEERRTDLALLYFRKAREAQERADIIRQSLMKHEELSVEQLRDEAYEHAGHSAADSTT